MLPACKLGKRNMAENDKALWSNNKTNLIVIRSNGNSGKTTTIWMLLYELVNRGAKIISLCYLDKTPFTLPATLPPANKRYDFIAELEWFKLRIVLFSQGDTPYAVEPRLDAIIATKPDYIVCASRSQRRTNSTWKLFETKYTNIHFRRVCFWSEYSTHQKDQLIVKEPTIEAIVKYIKP